MRRLVIPTLPITTVIDRIITDPVGAVVIMVGAVADMVGVGVMDGVINKRTVLM
ncbi:hypothetical protein MCAMS1_01544 [biofilm metagenome]